MHVHEVLVCSPFVFLGTSRTFSRGVTSRSAKKKIKIFISQHSQIKTVSTKCVTACPPTLLFFLVFSFAFAFTHV